MRASPPPSSPACVSRMQSFAAAAAPSAAPISRPIARSRARRCCALPASRCCAGNTRRSPGRNGRSPGAVPTARSLTRFAGQRERLRIPRIRAVDRRPPARRLPGDGAPARHADRALHRSCRRHRPPRRRCLEPAGRRARRCLHGRAARRIQSAGQDWGLAPFNPHALPAHDFAPLRQLMRAAMRHAGAIRLDHVLGLNRVFMIPLGRPAAERRLCAFSVRAVAARHRGGEQPPALHRHRRGSRHRAGGFPRDDRALGPVGLSRDAVRARG